MRRKLSRRDFIGLTALAAAAGAGLCGIGGIAGILLLRRRRLALMPTSTPLPTPTPTPFPITIVSRAAWGARPVNHEAEDEKVFATQENLDGWYEYTVDLATIYRTVAIHHSAFSSEEATTTALHYDTMIGLQTLHQDRRHWADIGYHYGIGADGTIYEGRDIHARGANVENYNWGTVGIVLMGNFEIEAPTDAQIASLNLLIAWLKLILNVTHLAAHSEFNDKTQCPGSHLKGLLDQIAQIAGLARGTGGYVRPPLSTFPTSTPSP